MLCCMDAYGFAVRPQHVQRYREYANIYKEEEEERSDRWNIFLERVSESVQLPVDGVAVDAADNKGHRTSEADTNHQISDEDVNGTDTPNSVDNGEQEPVVPAVEEKKTHKVQIWSNIRPSLRTIEDMMSVRVKKKNHLSKRGQDTDPHKTLKTNEEAKSSKGAPEDDSEEEFYDVERSDPIQDVPSIDSAASPATTNLFEGTNLDSSSPWKEELEVLVRGGLPMALRGELWQAFVGVKARRVENYYQNLLSAESNNGYKTNQEEINDKEPGVESTGRREKWKGQIEKDLPRTFPGHPALDENGRNALRRLLIAYARHNPSVGYCQAMNFFAGLLLLLMPEENAFWTLMGIMDDYFDGYYSEEMIECQVDQLVFEDLVRERFPKLGLYPLVSIIISLIFVVLQLLNDVTSLFAVNHLDYLGVQVAWVTGPWFLSIFMNMLPWESVLRVWDVLLFEGTRVMLFRTALALMELYGPALVTTKDAGDAVTLLQSLAGSTFDSSQLVLTACMGFQNVHEARLQELRDKNRPAVIAAIEERSKGLQALKSSQGLASKLFSFKHDPGSVVTDKLKVSDEKMNGDTTHMESGSTTPDDYFIGMTGGVEIDPGLDLQEQAGWLKVELCKLLEEKRSAELRAEELETALMEMVKQDNRRQLSARVEQLEQEVSELRRVLADKQEQESAMIQVLMRVEQEQKLTEDARRFAEQEAAVQRHAAETLQEKYDKVIASLAEMEKRVVMAESMLEATLQYQSGQMKVQPSPRSVQNNSSPAQSNMEPSIDVPPRKISLLARPFGLGWRDKNKGKPANTEESSDNKPVDEVQSPVVEQESNESEAPEKP
ncbi:TBC1 domain family member 8B-like isoform X2 [Chenopodium quinoa]|uniref:TBC1 domain family member 8B-like isoform X2 n=1 Tax=Chenopodium quinoa TaxID=63459 RepID=UPI000B792A46|nr:TBC1 domain family member 8B-like isoform X2 [Chenopodium quinoa]